MPSVVRSISFYSEQFEALAQRAHLEQRSFSAEVRTAIALHLASPSPDPPLDDIDPLEFARGALADLPADARQATAEQVAQATAAAEGVARHVDALERRLREVHATHADLVAETEAIGPALDRARRAQQIVGDWLTDAIASAASDAERHRSDLMTSDPIDFARTALEHLPDDPASCTEEDLATAAAASEGLARHAYDVRDRLARLAQDLAAGAATGTTARRTLTELDHRLEACLSADASLSPYLAAAAAASGHPAADAASS